MNEQNKNIKDQDPKLTLRQRTRRVAAVVLTAVGLTGVAAMGAPGPDTSPVDQETSTTSTIEAPKSTSTTITTPEETSTTIASDPPSPDIPSITLEFPSEPVAPETTSTLAPPDVHVPAESIERQQEPAPEIGTAASTIPEMSAQESSVTGNPGQIDPDNFSNPDGVEGSATRISR